MTDKSQPLLLPRGEPVTISSTLNGDFRGHLEGLQD